MNVAKQNLLQNTHHSNSNFRNLVKKIVGSCAAHDLVIHPKAP